MNDPHVVSLTYRVQTPADVTLKEPPLVSGQMPEFRYRLEGTTLCVLMDEHHPSFESARSRVDPFVRAWQLEAALQRDAQEFTFSFQGGRRIDRNPTNVGAKGEVHASLEMVMAVDEAVAEKILENYPPPPAGMKPSVDTDLMWQAYNAYLEGRDKLTSMGFYCLSLLQFREGTKTSRQDVATKYKIDLEVLKTLGTLTSDVGTEETARKLEMSSQVRCHTDLEVAWIREVVKLLIRRKAAYDFDPTATLLQITMARLPQLSP